ncbi:MAG: phosphate ABC transporter permease PstA [Pseudomonadota bacterium]
MTDTTTQPAFDMAKLSAKHTSQESEARIKRRHWAEFRLKAYGILAILFAAVALVILVYTIVAKTLTVTNEFYLSLNVPIELTDRQSAALTDDNPNTNANLENLIYQAIGEQLEAPHRGRSARPLKALVSTYEGFSLGEIVGANPDLIGGDYHFEALLDDNLQLYMKGDFGRLRDAGSAGPITISAGESEDQVVISAASNAFGNSRIAMREDRAAEGRALRRSARDQERAFNETQDTLDDTTDPEERDRLQKLLDGFGQQRDQIFARADAALTEATDQRNNFTLRTDDPSVFIRANGGWIKITEMEPERLIGTVMNPLTGLGEVAEGKWSGLLMTSPEAERKISDRQLLWMEDLKREDRIVTHFNQRVLFSSDSAQAELAGIWGALIGSFWTMMVTFAIVFPIGVMASIYLEEFAPKNRLTDFIEVNINNLAAVPSIVFGLLGLTILLSGVKLFGIELFDGLLKAFAEDPRSTPLAGGVVLALMSLPTIIIASRASIKAVPPSIRDAALGLGASKLQTSTHHVLPLAMPGILTGSIIAMAQALGETAPLIIIGMNSFIQDPPGGPLDKGNVLPSLIYLWNNNSERLFDGKTAVAISVLLIFLILMNALAVVLRKRFERRW